MVYFRTGLNVGIISNEQISRYSHHKLSELILLELAGHTEPSDWQYFLKMRRTENQSLCATKDNFQANA